MKVSVLVPVYGVEEFIAQCATNLMDQTYKDVEYIFVNDCTPDASIDQLKQVIEQYPERRQQVKILNHAQNLGSAIARKTALNAATGDAVVFVDSDDYVESTMIEKLVDKMLTTRADIVDGGYSIVNNGASVKQCYPMHVSDKAYLKAYLCQNVESNRIWGRLIKRSLFVDNNITFFKGVDYGEDFSVLPRLLINARRSWVDECLYYYRDDNSQSYTNNITTKSAISFLKAQQIVGEYLLNHPRWKTFAVSTQMGWVNVWRFARSFNVERSLVEEHFKLKPTCLTTQFLTALMKSRLPFKLVNFIYMSSRRIYLLMVK